MQQHTEPLVAEGMVRILVLDMLRQPDPDSLLRAAPRAVDRPGEKVLQRIGALTALQILPANTAPQSRGMYAHQLCRVLLHKRRKTGRRSLKERQMRGQNQLRAALQRFAPPLHVGHHPLRLLQLLPQKVLRLRILRLCQESGVVAVDPELRHIKIIQHHLQSVTAFYDENIRRDIFRRKDLCRFRAARMRRQPADQRRRLLHLLLRDAQLFRQSVPPLLPQKRQIACRDALCQRRVLRHAPQLQQQALRQIPRRYSRRLQLL